VPNGATPSLNSPPCSKEIAPIDRQATTQDRSTPPALSTSPPPTSPPTPRQSLLPIRPGRRAASRGPERRQTSPNDSHRASFPSVVPTLLLCAFPCLFVTLYFHSKQHLYLGTIDYGLRYCTLYAALHMWLDPIKILLAPTPSISSRPTSLLINPLSGHTA
jgi:hypothetical protein